jgi:hypothetical protein
MFNRFGRVIFNNLRKRSMSSNAFKKLNKIKNKRLINKNINENVDKISSEISKLTKEIKSGSIYIQISLMFIYISILLKK